MTLLLFQSKSTHKHLLKKWCKLTTLFSMKTFAFTPTSSLKSLYDNALLRRRKHDMVWDIIKIGILGVFWFSCLLTYLIFVSRSSTRGYFLRQENQKFNTISFQYEILKTQILEQRQKSWGEIANSTKKREMLTVLID